MEYLILLYVASIFLIVPVFILARPREIKRLDSIFRRHGFILNKNRKRATALAKHLSAFVIRRNIYRRHEVIFTALWFKKNNEAEFFIGRLNFPGKAGNGGSRHLVAGFIEPRMKLPNFMVESRYNQDNVLCKLFPRVNQIPGMRKKLTYISEVDKQYFLYVPPTVSVNDLPWNLLQPLLTKELDTQLLIDSMGDTLVISRPIGPRESNNTAPTLILLDKLLQTFYIDLRRTL